MPPIFIIIFCLLAVIGLGIAALKWLRKHVTIERIDPYHALELKFEEKPLYRHVQVIVQYELLDTDNMEETEDILNTLFLPIYNGVILTHKISKELFLAAARSTSLKDQMDFDNITDEELLSITPSVYCEDADIIQRSINGISLYTVDFNTEFEHFEGDNYREFFE